MTPAAWYTDPQNPSLLRWWDGVQWTAHTAPSSNVASPQYGAQTYAPAAVPYVSRSVDDPTETPSAVEINQELIDALAELDASETTNERLRAEVQALQSEVARLRAEGSR